MSKVGVSKADRGKRYRGTSELRTAVMTACKAEYGDLRQRLGIPPDHVRAVVVGLIGDPRRDAQARRLLLQIRDSLDRALELLREERKAYVGGVRGSSMELLRAVEGEIESHRRAMGNVLEGLWSALVRRSKAILPRARDPLAAAETLNLRHGVLVLFSSVYDAGTNVAPPTPRELAIASLLAGTPFEAPLGRGTTVAEVIIKESKAMREALRTWRRRGYWP